MKVLFCAFFMSSRFTEADAYVLDFQRWISLNFLANSSVTLPGSPVVELTGPFVPSLYVDEAWHNLILFTREYHVCRFFLLVFE